MARRTTKADDSQVYQLKMTLKWLRPPIWRRIQVRGSTTLLKLHQIIQVAMGGWDDSHLHMFRIGGSDYSMPEFGMGDDMPVQNELRTRLADVVTQEKQKFTYLYDFGDSWEIDLVVEKILPPEPDAVYPICLKGKRAGPPDDVGGVPGFVDFVEALNDPAHPNHEDMTDWWGEEGFDPEAFDLAAVNAGLRKL